MTRWNSLSRPCLKNLSGTLLNWNIQGVGGGGVHGYFQEPHLSQSCWLGTVHIPRHLNTVIFPVQVCVRAGIYHGSEALCDITSTKPQTGSNPTWNEYLDFDLDVNNIPRMARLCLVIYCVAVDKRKTRSKRREVTVIYLLFTVAVCQAVAIRQSF